jgi:hypothetical protein
VRKIVDKFVKIGIIYHVIHVPDHERNCSMNAVLNDPPPLLSLQKAARLHPAFADLAHQTLTKYARQGVVINDRLVKLESVQVGNVTKTSQAALTRFALACEAARDGNVIGQILSSA